MHARQADRRGRVAAAWFDQDLFGRHLRQLLDGQTGKGGAGDDINMCAVDDTRPAARPYPESWSGRCR